jgi:shikimate kinase
MSESESGPPRHNIVLVGFMGCGKSTVARALHQRLGYELVDMDQMIEDRAGKPISRIFEEKGEDGFRAMESGLLRELATDDKEGRIISTGGGVVAREENRALLRKTGYVVWLKVTAETVLDRTSRSKHRPLLQTEDPQGRVLALLAEREPLYDEVAHLTLETEGLEADEVLAGILECAGYYFAHSA